MPLWNERKGRTARRILESRKGKREIKKEERKEERRKTGGGGGELK